MLNMFVPLTGENCSGRKENQRNHQSAREDKRGEVPGSRSRERVPRQRGPEREKGSDSRHEETRKGRHEEEKGAGGVEVSQGI